jgi:hypothetical protein
MSLALETSTANDRSASPDAPGILQVLPSLNGGGVERGTVDVAAAIVQAGWRAIVVSAGGPMVRELLRAGATHIALPVDSRSPFARGRNTRLLMEVVREYNVSLIHARSRAPAWAARAATKKLGLPFVTTFITATAIR